MKTAVLNFKTEPSVKKSLQTLAKRFGVSVSFIIDQAVRETLSRGTVEVKELVPNKETIRAINQADRDYKAGKLKSYESVDDFMKSLRKK